jgi:tribbles-like protein
MLYTMLVGRYPFHDTEPSALFTKIRRGHYTIPDTISSRAKCLIRSLLRRDPHERLSGNEILQHPWFSSRFPCRGPLRADPKDCDQTVPDILVTDDDSSLFL